MQIDPFNTVFRVADWNKVFENSETRKLARLERVQIPNKMHGMGFKRLAAHQHKVELLCAWYLICEVVSQHINDVEWFEEGGKKRCRLVRERRGITERDGRPLTPDDFSLITGYPPGIFEKALLFFSEPKMGWLIPLEHTATTNAPIAPTAHLDGDSGQHSTDATNTHSTGSSDLPTDIPGGQKVNLPEPPGVSGRMGGDGIGEEGREDERERARAGEFEIDPPLGFPRSEIESQAGCELIIYRAVDKPNRACTPEFASNAWHEIKSRGWRDRQDAPIRNWPSYLRAAWGRQCAFEDRKATPTSSPSTKSSRGLFLSELNAQLREVEAEMKRIVDRGNYGPEGNTVKPEDKPRYRELKAQRETLRKKIVDFGKPQNSTTGK
jgi:hypothetical protein